jgi:hypothetical protein
MNLTKIGNARQQADSGIAVVNAQPLAHCWLELKQALTRLGTRPADLPVKDLVLYGAMHPDPDSPEGQAWIENCLINDLAALELRLSVANGALPIWRIHDAREVMVAPVVLDQDNVRYGIFKTHERPAPEWEGARLWVKRPDWEAFMATNVVPDPAIPRAPSAASYVPLSEALSWIAFGIAMNPELMFHLLKLGSYASKIPQEAIQQAVAELVTKAGDGCVALRGKYQENRQVDNRCLDTVIIEPIKLADFRQYQHLYDALCYGDGLSWWRHESGVEELFASGRRDAFVGVTVNRTDLLREFPNAADVTITEIAVVPLARKKPGPRSDADWPWAVEEVLLACVNGGYAKPLARGMKAAIATQLLAKMAERDKHFSDDSAAKYARDVIARLPDNSAS